MIFVLWTRDTFFEPNAVQLMFAGCVEMVDLRRVELRSCSAIHATHSHAYPSVGTIAARRWSLAARGGASEIVS